MPYNFAADSFHTKKLCSRLSSSEVRLYRKNGPFAFLSPPLGDLGATYADHLVTKLSKPDYMQFYANYVNKLCQFFYC